MVVATILFFSYTMVSGLQGDDSYYVLNTINGLQSLFKESFDATMVYYQTWNGRFIVNFINILIVNCGIVVQTIAVLIILTGVVYTIYRLLNIRYPFFVFVAIILFGMLMGSDEFLFNSSCLNIVCNYLLPIPFYLLMVKAIVEDKAHYGLMEWMGLCLLALISGSLIETYSFSLALVVIVMVITKKFHLNVQKTVIGLFYAIGCLTLLLCPGSFTRSDVLYDGLLGIVYRLNGIVGCFSDWMILPALFFGLTMVFTKTKWHGLSSLEQTLLLYAGMQIVVMCIAPYFPPRALLMVNFILVAIGLNRLSHFEQSGRISALVALTCAIALCGQLAIAFGRILFAG